jgi:hypothetical protein
MLPLVRTTCVEGPTAVTFVVELSTNGSEETFSCKAVAFEDTVQNDELKKFLWLSEIRPM